jgi:acyl-CoA synthetase (AMP-forming)/AMP-acid ligase II
MKALTIVDRFSRLAELRQGDVIMTTESTHYTFLEVRNQSALMAASLARLGIEAGDRVALHAFNIPELVVAIMGCLEAGAVVVPLNTRLKAAELEVLCKLARPKLYIGQHELMQRLEQCNEETLPQAARYTFDGPPDEKNWRHLLKGGRGECLAVKRELSDPALLLSTSGTTGKPKLVVWTHQTLLSIADEFDGHELFEDDIIMQQMPMMHAGGLLQMAYALCYGARLVLLAKFDEAVALDIVQRNRCTSILATPTMYAAMIRCQQRSPRDLSSLRLCITAGDVCPPETERAFARETGRLLHTRWGATEDLTSARHGRMVGPFISPAAPDSCKVVDDEGNDVEPGVQGELWSRSAGTTPGYWLEDESVDRLPGGWFRSGDLVRQEEDGQLRYMGRAKDLIVRGGSNISPLEIEAVLTGDELVQDVAVLGIADGDLGSRVGAILRLRDGHENASARDIIARIRGKLADYKVPEFIKVVPELPRNALGKLDRKALHDIGGDWTPV